MNKNTSGRLRNNPMNLLVLSRTAMLVGNLLVDIHNNFLVKRHDI